MNQLTLKSDELKELASNIQGEVVAPGSDDYERARRVWNGLIDRRPVLIVRCRGAGDVSRAVRFARERGLRVTVRSGGHNVAGIAVSDGAMMIDLSVMRGVHVDPEKRVARVEGGARLGDLDRKTQAFGLAAPVGVVSATGVAGLTLHGGIGWLLRKHGMSVDNLRVAEVVTADGRAVRASASENPDLLWALKGGGGSYGVVTSFEFNLHPVGPDVWFAAPMYPLDRAEDLLRFWRGYMEEAPDELSSIATLWAVPCTPEAPEDLRGVPAVIFLACYSGPFERGEEAIRPLREMGKPLLDLSTPIKYVDLQRFIDTDYPDGRLYYWKSLYLSGMNEEAIETLVSRAARRPSPLTSLDIWALGGAFGRVGESETPFVHRQAPLLLAIESNWEDPSETAANIDWSRKLHDDMGRFSTGGSYLNFPGMAEEGEGLLARAYGRNYARMKELKAKYDPEGFFGQALR